MEINQIQTCGYFSFIWFTNFTNGKENINVLENQYVDRINLNNHYKKLKILNKFRMKLK